LRELAGGIVNMDSRRCVVCKTEFAPKNGIQKLCGNAACRKEQSRIIHQLWEHKLIKKVTDHLGRTPIKCSICKRRVCTKHVPRYEREVCLREFNSTCAFCGENFTTQYKTKVYCSKRCKFRNHTKKTYLHTKQRKQTDNAYRERYLAMRREHRRKYRLSHRNEIREECRKYRLSHKNVIREYRRKYRLSNPEEEKTRRTMQYLRKRKAMLHEKAFVSIVSLLEANPIGQGETHERSITPQA